jgi:acyl-CoA thioesterase
MVDSTGADDIPGTPQAIAEAVRAHMYRRDRAAQTQGITIEAIGPGHAVCRMPVREDMLNGHATCHGGLVFTLADTAFAYACNACNRATVALACQISYIAPARQGDVLTATAREQSRTGRTGVYDVEVRRADGTIVALFRGNAYETKGVVARSAP